MKIDKKLMNEVEELWVGHEEALTHFGQVCVAAAKAGHDCKVRRHLRLGMVVAIGNYHHYMLFRFDERNLLKRERLAETRALSFIFPVYFAFPAISLCFALIIIYDSVGIVK